MSITEIKKRTIELINEKGNDHISPRIISISTTYQDITVAFVTDTGIVYYVVEFHYEKEFSRVRVYPCFCGYLTSHELMMYEEIASKILKED